MNSLRIKLSIMMFLEFFIWGCWLPQSFGYFEALKFTGWQLDGLNLAFPISAIIAMFVGNQFVDRNFAAEKFLAFSHFVGGIALIGFGLLCWFAFQTEIPQPASYWLFFLCMAIHCIFYVPTISVTNAIAFRNLTDAQKEFGPIRLWGTIGWIAAAWPFIFILVDWQAVSAALKAIENPSFIDWLGTALGTPLKGQLLFQSKSWVFLVGGAASLVLAVFSLLLPHTPPKPAKSDDAKFAWLEAMSLLKHPFLLVLFIVTFIDAMIHDGYFVFAFDYLADVGVKQNWIQPAMSVGQIAEIATMALLGYVLKTFGWRTTMIIGILGHAARFAIFAFVQDPYAAVAVNLLHGICYAFFFATLYIFVDEVFPKDASTSAQGLFNFLILGVGQIASRFVWHRLKAAYTIDEEIQYFPLLLFPSGLAIFAAVLLLLFFHPPAKPVPESVGH